ncbi:helix-turn-helix transcriptional regulator [Pelagovum pacificum]|nr:autoinducer binding domain-containing protein [Pelagovum pacificum]QQA42949.1 autoinducer binding domain-containing protein [Pelagovum pacificum]
MTTRFANLLIDTADVLAVAEQEGDTWAAINRVANRIGAIAVNAGAFLRSDQQIAWMRSSMNSRWLEDYGAQGFHQTDPLLRAAMAGTAPRTYDVAGLEAAAGPDRTHGALHDGMMSHGYNYMITRSWFEGTAGKCLVFSCRDDPTDMFGPGTERALSAVSAMLTHSLTPPDGSARDGLAFGSGWSDLDPAERDVLSYLVNGYNVALIAETLSLTEPDVVRLIRSASRRMRAETTDQALSLALTRGLLSV